MLYVVTDPTDEEKEEISKEANITVFQLSHWYVTFLVYCLIDVGKEMPMVSAGVY